ncbi:DUF4350 domain-containing protein [Gordonia insulae]|uniref:DUF4350 domain-containing protein n=1 Tax=Gordonia insulae TaxID=2420509 RepID=UPI001E50B8D1|nr:DUF4350 domain-containing protein [Gordonia insulae]
MTTAAPPSAPAVPPSSGGARRNWIGWTLVAVVVIAALVGLVVIAGGRGQERTDPLDPENPGPAGTAALAAVLDDHGVPVAVARGQGDLLAEPRPGSATTMVMSETDELTESTARSFLDRARDADRIIVISPTARSLELLGLPILPGYSAGVTDAVDADCTLDGIAADDVVLHDTSGYRPTPGNTSPTTCFTIDDTSGLISVPATAGRPEIIVVSGLMLQNSEITRFDNAGVAVRTFGHADRLIWYIPDHNDGAVGGDGDEDSDIPRAVGPLVLLAFFGLLALMFWRGRRFGPLVTEPLPAVVKAIETTQARGRMYHKARADARTAGQLRVHTIDRIARHLGLPYDAAQATAALGDGDVATSHHQDPRLAPIVAAASRTAGLDPRQVGALLGGPLPQTPDDLLRFVTDLTALEKEVRRTP